MKTTADYYNDAAASYESAAASYRMVRWIIVGALLLSAYRAGWFK